jgi:hypothetical protein
LKAVEEFFLVSERVHSKVRKKLVNVGFRGERIV